MQLQGTVYIDSVFLLNLVMDLYLLTLTAKVLGKTATYPRIFAGSIAGATGYCMILCIPGVPYIGKVILGMFPIGMLMIKITYRTKGLKELLRTLGYLYVFSFLLGGFMIFLKGKMILFGKYQDSVLILALFGFAGYVLCSRGIEQYQRRKNNCFCRVCLEGDVGRVEIQALVDTGNGLTDPVSKRPVAILDEEVWFGMKRWMKPEKYKMIPYHSIGREQGLLEGYVIDSMEVMKNSEKKQYENVIITVFKGRVSTKGSYQMILPPELSI